MGHELTNLFILAGSLFLLFIGYLAYQLASTEKGTRINWFKSQGQISDSSC